MANAHAFDAMICIANCDKIVPGMIMGALRVNIPTIFASGGPMLAGRMADGNAVDLDRAMVALAQNGLQYAASAKAAGKKLAILRYVASDGAA